MDITKVKLIEPDKHTFVVPKEVPLSPIEIPKELIESAKVPYQEISLTTIDKLKLTYYLLPYILGKKMKDWKTTFAGIGSAVLLALSDYIGNGGKITITGAVAAAGLAVLGWFSSDSKEGK